MGCLTVARSSTAVAESVCRGDFGSGRERDGGSAAGSLQHAGHPYGQPTPDGSFIALRTRTDVGTVTELRLVVNWFDELRRIAPRK